MFDQSKPEPFDEDLHLVERFISGDVDAFDTLYARYFEKVFAIASGVLLRQDEAADATQEIFTLVYRNLPKFDRRSKFTTWLYRVAVNRSIQQARSVKHHRSNVPLDEVLERPSVPEKETDPRVAYALERLSPDDRAAITLFYWEDLSLAEIGESMGISANAAKTRLFRARERFKTFFEEAPE